MNFNEYWDDFKKNKSLAYNYDEIAAVTWESCKSEVLTILKNTKSPKVPGMEGLGGYHWEEMDAETFREILIKEIQKL